MNTKNLTNNEKRLLIEVINHSADGQHPDASYGNLKYFEDSYVYGLLAQARPHLVPKHKATATRILNKYMIELGKTVQALYDVTHNIVS